MTKGVQCDDEEEGFGEPERVVGEARGCPGSENSAAEKTETDETEVASFATASFASLSGGFGAESVIDAFGDVAQVAGGEGGVESERVDATEAGDLHCGNVGDDRGEGHVWEAQGEPSEEKEAHDFKQETEHEGPDAEAGAHMFGGGDADEIAGDGDEMGDDFVPVLSNAGDTEEDKIAGHGGGKDVAVKQINRGVEQAPGGGQQCGVKQGVGLERRIAYWHGGRIGVGVW
jgi:hypothetical protein